jgi:hypothetical protein
LDINKKWHSHQKYEVTVTERSQRKGVKRKMITQIKWCGLAKDIKAKERKTRTVYIIAA